MSRSGTNALLCTLSFYFGANIFCNSIFCFYVYSIVQNHKVHSSYFISCLLCQKLVVFLLYICWCLYNYSFFKPFDNKSIFFFIMILPITNILGFDFLLLVIINALFVFLFNLLLEMHPPSFLFSLWTLIIIFLYYFILSQHHSYPYFSFFVFSCSIRCITRRS